MTQFHVMQHKLPRRPFDKSPNPNAKLGQGITLPQVYPNVSLMQRSIHSTLQASIQAHTSIALQIKHNYAAQPVVKIHALPLRVRVRTHSEAQVVFHERWRFIGTAWHASCRWKPFSCVPHLISAENRGMIRGHPHDGQDNERESVDTRKLYQEEYHYP